LILREVLIICLRTRSQSFERQIAESLLQEFLMASRSGLSHKTRRAAGRSVPRRIARAATDADLLALQTLQEFRTIFASARRHDAEVRHLAGIPGSQLWALAEIARSGGMAVSELSERMALHQTTASNLSNALVERRLIRRERDESDQRIVRLHVTTEGKRLLLKAPGPYAGLLVDALRNIETSDLRRLKSALAVLTRVIRHAATDAAGQTLMGE
jgi:MarR family transcriptional regulator, organic hydroperoxide resistance regulator